MMDISIISDTHFGYKWGEERGGDPFENAEEAFRKALDSDVIILPGDIFDRKIPKQEVLDRASEVLSVAMEGERTVETDKDLGMHGDGIPVVAIHGTHERRPRSYTNPIELMDRTGHLHHLDDEKIVFEKDGEKVAIHGMSGVPERQAPEALEEFDPEPVEDAFNILVLHQSIEGLVYTDDDHDVLSPEDLPEGFDIIINGHIHWYDLKRFPEGEKPLVLPGSTVTTQMRKIEAEKDKGFLKLDTEEEELGFVRLDSARDVNYIELEVEDENWLSIKEDAVERLENVKGEKPLVNLKITGETSSRINPRELKQMFREDMFLNVNSSVSRPETSERVEMEEQENPWDEGKKILKKEVDADLEVDQDEFLQLLEDGKPEEAAEMLKDVGER